MAESTVTVDSKLTGSDTRRRVQATMGASSGNLVKWFDFYVYSLCSFYLAYIFFPFGNTTTQLLQTAGVFAAGFLVCPIGGQLFDRIVDRHGHKKSMLLSVYTMCSGPLVIVCLPGYETIGTRAPTLLLPARLFQGLSVGGEHGTSVTYISEVTAEGCKGFYASSQYVTSIDGQLLALLVVVVLQHTMEDVASREWGWCIPFALGAVLAVVALWLRRQLDETSQQETRVLKEVRSLKGLRCSRRALIMVPGFTAAGPLCFYTFTIHTQRYLVNTAGMHINVANGIMTTVLLVFMLTQPLIGALLDKIGHRAPILCSGSLAAIFIVPILSALQNVSSPYVAFGLAMCVPLVVGFYTLTSEILKAEIFPAQARALGVGLSCAAANAIFGGSAEYVALSLKSVGMETAFLWYVTLMVVVAFLVSLMLHCKGKGACLQ